jgi:hypothetical protein
LTSDRAGFSLLDSDGRRTASLRRDDRKERDAFSDELAAMLSDSIEGFGADVSSVTNGVGQFELNEIQ